jgi:putative FmdB family regulatory protein
MPKYDIRCLPCDYLWEEVLSFKEDPPECPACGSMFTKIVWTTMPMSPKAPRDEWDLQRNVPEEPKKFSKVHRKS